MNKSKIQEKVRTHVIYKKLDGSRLPGVTTILGILNKPALLSWAWGLGNQGISMDAYRDDLAGVGKLVHAMILEHYSPQLAFDKNEYSANDHDRAANSFLSFLEWERRHTVKPYLLETAMVDEEEEYGGTPDFVGLVDDIPTLLDFKSGSGIYKESFYQGASYRHLVEFGFFLADEERKIPIGYKTDRAIILNIGRAENEDFTEVVINRPQSVEWEIFRAARRIYRLEKELKKSG